MKGHAAALWRIQRYAALIALPLLGFHVVFQLFFANENGIEQHEISSRLSITAYLLVNIVLLVSVTLHAFLGLRSITVDYAKNPQTPHRITFICVGAACCLILFGLLSMYAFM